MTERYLPEQLFENGVTGLLPVIPPGAQLVPSSKISQASVGKIPGRRAKSGLWGGFNWRAFTATLEDVRTWRQDGANVGLRAEGWPGVDIDCTDARLAQIIQNLALAQLGPAPIRIGKPPKRLLMYRLADGAEPFSRLRLWIKGQGDAHLVEILGEGQQYLIHGMHPSGRPYEWNTDPSACEIPAITREGAVAFLDYLQPIVEMLGYGVEREGDGRRVTRVAAADQSGLLAPSIEELSRAVALIENTNDLFPTRTDWLRMGYAIRAAAGPSFEEDGFDIFADFSARWDGNDRSAGNDAEYTRENWRRMTADKSVGWSWIAEVARGFGFNDAALDFEIEAEMPEPAGDEAAPMWGDQWLAEQIVDTHKSVLRFVPERGGWIVWDGKRWVLDAALRAEDQIAKGLKLLALRALREGASEKEKKEALGRALRISSAATAAAVTKFVRANRAIAVEVAALDHNPWVLNTPAGLVDLMTGKVHSPDPDALVTKMTIVAPDFDMSCPIWEQFLDEVTLTDRELRDYLQRLCGYALTGIVREQQVTFVFGDGGNGKGVFLNTVSGIMGDYATVASMDTFMASSSDKHSTDLAMLMGARLVIASETTQGKRWDEQRVKSVSGGDPVSARFMRQDNFTFQPTCKLVFTGNHQPELRDAGAAMRRRLHMVPFTYKPPFLDLALPERLRAEWPAILAWMIRGCIAWQEIGLLPPQRVLAETTEYFAAEDATGRWLDECADVGDDYRALSDELFLSWREWANRNNEFVGTMKRFASALRGKGFEKWRDGATRRRGYKGVQVNREWQELSIVK